MSRIFISYRRSDSISEAGHIYYYLANHFGRASIFKDVDNIDAGVDVRDCVIQAVGQCQILLAVIGKSWLHATDTEGNRRLENPADWVRLEIETALNRRIRVIPVLLTGVDMPVVQSLPMVLQPLANLNAARVRYDPDFARDMERLVGNIERYFESLSKKSAEAQFVATPPPISRAVATPPRNRPSVRPVSQPRTPVSQPSRVVPPQVASKWSAVGQKGDEKLLSRLGNGMSRRRAMQVLGFTGGGIGTLLVGKQLLSSGTSSDVSEGTEAPPVIQAPLTEADFETVQFKTVTVNDKGETIRQEDSEARVFREKIGEVPLDMVWIPGGTFMMGSPESEAERRDSEGPRHDVTIQPFLMGRYEITQAQWRRVAVLDKVDIDLEVNPAHFSDGGDNRPVEKVSWFEAMEFCKRLSADTGRAYRLPSEAEWEYACRAGTTTPFYFGETLTAELANYNATKVYQNEEMGEYRETTTEVGSFSANGFGLYDMHGNVSEWCADHWHNNYEGAPTDGIPWLSDGWGTFRILRGGAWLINPWNCRSAFRSNIPPGNRNDFVGFRVSCSAPRALL